MIDEVASIVIDCPVEEVYKFLTVPGNRLKYDPDLIDVRQTPAGPLGIGTKIVEERSMMGKKGEMVTEVSELEPNQLIGYRTLKEDPMNAFGFYQFDSVPEGTRLTLNFTLDPRGFMKLVVPFIAGKMKRDIGAGLRDIKAVLEHSE